MCEWEEVEVSAIVVQHFGEPCCDVKLNMQ